MGRAQRSRASPRVVPGAGRPMVHVPGGEFWMGSDHHYPEERPAHRVRVDAFLIDVAPVTNAEFAAFVAATGYVTVAEKRPDPRDYPGASPGMLKPGSLVFTPPDEPVDLHDWRRWWSFRFRACWRRPYGPGTGIREIEDHPVVHVAHADAAAYAQWVGKELPTEAEWEFAARGGLDGAEFAWGDELEPGGRPMANTWQGAFPTENLATDGFERTSPVASFPPNGYGLYDMIGNVWEWTADWWTRAHPAAGSCCIAENPRGGSEEASRDPAEPAVRIPRKVVKGGSHLCAPNYCRRYRPAARHAQPIDSAMSHLGFRCVRRGGDL